MKERGDHFPWGAKIFCALRDERVANMFTAFTRQAADSATT